MTTPEKQQKDLQKRVEKYAKENTALLKKYELATRIIIDLSHLRKIPMSVKFAAWILDRKGAMPKMQFINLKK